MIALLLPLAAFQEAKPEPFEARGRLVCLLEEMKAVHGIQVPPVHEHLAGFKTLEGRLYTLLRTAFSEALFVDARFKERELRLTGRVLAGSLLDLSLFQWYRDGALHDVWYWCEVCAIRGVDPALCACCQAPVELREGPAKK